MLSVLIQLMERGLLPDAVIRMGIRKLCQNRLQTLSKLENEQGQQFEKNYVDMLKKSAVAVETKAANEQHYELPASFFTEVLGPYRKYSCGIWNRDCKDLAQSEKDALELTMDRAQITDGMKILELGCGWGSLTFAMAQKFPKTNIVAVSNSTSQKKFIDDQAQALGIKNITVLTRDLGKTTDFGPEYKNFDRVVSVEMFEHLRNYEMLFERISSWLSPQGKLFVHIFTHQKFSYLFETEGEDNWMGRYFFTGGQMPSQKLLLHFQKEMQLEMTWQVNGQHYQKTSEAWLKNMDQKKDQVMQILIQAYGPQAPQWYHRWRVFFLSCAELFGYAKGTEWGVTHYLFSKTNPVN